MNAIQEELKQRIASLQKVSKENIDLPEQLVNRIISGEFDNQLFVIESTLHLTLVASHTQKGRQLFLKTLEYVKNIFPETAAEFWQAYDDFDNLHKNGFYDIPNEEKQMNLNAY